jgi:predicted dehydrogenase
MGDIGSHAHNLAEYITGSPFTKVRAWLQAVVPGRGLDDDGMVFFEQDNGITGVFTASQICAGEENMLRIRVYGEKGGLDWCQEEPNTLMVKYADGRQERHRAGANLSDEAARITRTPSGHPEGYLEAFATLYSDFAKNLRGEGDHFVPNIDEALRGMTFIESVVESSAQGGAWLDMKY